MGSEFEREELCHFVARLYLELLSPILTGDRICVKDSDSMYRSIDNLFRMAHHCI